MKENKRITFLFIVKYLKNSIIRSAKCIIMLTYFLQMYKVFFSEHLSVKLGCESMNNLQNFTAAVTVIREKNKLSV